MQGRYGERRYPTNGTEPHKFVEGVGSGCHSRAEFRQHRATFYVFHETSPQTVQWKARITSTEPSAVWEPPKVGRVRVTRVYGTTSMARKWEKHGELIHSSSGHELGGIAPVRRAKHWVPPAKPSSR